MTDSHYSTLVLRGTGIRQDNQGRFCLNDLHRASGGAPNKKPSNWLRTEQAQELMAELRVCSNMSIPLQLVKTGSNIERGTYVARELVYAYAMWISPAFHLAVIRAFDSSQNELSAAPQPMVEKPSNPSPRFRTMESAFRQMMKVALLCGATRREAMERAGVAVKRRWGVNPLEEMGLSCSPLQHGELFDRIERERGHE